VLSEFSVADSGENVSLTVADAVYDLPRVDYFASYLNGLLEAKVEDGVNVTGVIWHKAFRAILLNYTSVRITPDTWPIRNRKRKEKTEVCEQTCCLRA
jgi:hypothetical protein